MLADLDCSWVWDGTKTRFSMWFLLGIEPVQRTVSSILNSCCSCAGRQDSVAEFGLFQGLSWKRMSILDNMNCTGRKDFVANMGCRWDLPCTRKLCWESLTGLKSRTVLANMDCWWDWNDKKNCIV